MFAVVGSPPGATDGTMSARRASPSARIDYDKKTTVKCDPDKANPAVMVRATRDAGSDLSIDQEFSSFSRDRPKLQLAGKLTARVSPQR